MAGQRYVRGLAVGLVALLAAPAAATTFVRMDAGDLAARSDAAVIATVTAVSAVATLGGGVVTHVELAPEQVVFGALPSGPLRLHELGGDLAGRSERIFGTPRYRAGERVLAFVRRGRDGAWRTTAMAMGRYVLDADASGALLARREFGDAVVVLDPASGAVLDTAATAPERLVDVLAGCAAKPVALRPAASRPAVARPTPSAAGRTAAAPFTYLGTPSRWFEPDAGEAVTFRIDPAGAAGLGAAASVAAVVDALAVWTGVDGVTLQLTAAPLDAPASFAGCGGATRIVFEDPFDEIEDPLGCRGVLGIGGFCYTDESRVIGGASFRRIRVGKVTFADGWAGCPGWNACNLAEVATHEIGHALGLGHSTDSTATMAASANFDGRCAALAADDIAGLRALYPAPATPTATPTATPLPATATATAAPPTATAALPTATVALPGARALSGRITYYASGIAVPGVRIPLRGAGLIDLLSGGDGAWAVADLAAGDWSVEPRKDGDVGVAAVSALDAAWVLQASAGLRLLDAERQIACDVTGNGSVSPLDAARILQRTVGAIDQLPAAAACASDFVFFPVGVGAANRAAVAPRLAVEDCRRGALTYAPLVGNAGGQDFRAALVGDCTGNWLPGGPRIAEGEPAPAGTALALGAPRRIRGGRWRLPVGVRAPGSVHALEVELRFDPDRLVPGSPRSVHLGATALVQARLVQPGRLAIAIASALPLPSDGRALAVVDFTARVDDVGPRSVRAYAVAVDDRPVAAPPR